MAKKKKDEEYITITKIGKYCGPFGPITFPGGIAMPIPIDFDGNTVVLLPIIIYGTGVSEEEIDEILEAISGEISKGRVAGFARPDSGPSGVGTVIRSLGRRDLGNLEANKE